MMMVLMCVIAMVFILFDVEIAFLYPWALIFRTLGLFGLVELVKDQQKTLEVQKQEIDELRKQLEETKKLSLSDHNRLEELSQAAPQPTVSKALEGCP